MLPRQRSNQCSCAGQCRAGHTGMSRDCGAPIVELSLHQPGADVGVRCQSQGVKSAVSRCMQLKLAS